MRRTASTLLILASLALLLGCDSSTTSLKSSWAAPGLQGPLQYKKVLIACVAKDPERRKQAEGFLSVVLKNATGVPSYMAIPDADVRDKEKVRRILAENGFDGVVTVRYLGQGQQTTWVSDPYQDFWGFYDYAWPWAYGAGYEIVDTKYCAEIRIYSVADGKQIWAGLSDTYNPASGEQALRDIAGAVGADLKKRGLVP
jgi:hypothetical protein